MTDEPTDQPTDRRTDRGIENLHFLNKQISQIKRRQNYLATYIKMFMHNLRKIRFRISKNVRMTVFSELKKDSLLVLNILF